MPSWFRPKSLVYPKMMFVDQFGNSNTIDLTPYSPGYDSESKAETIRRVRPIDLKAHGALTGHGGHQRERSLRAPVSWSEPSWPPGASVRYIDVDPLAYTANGMFLTPPVVDWQTALRLAVKDQKVNLAQTLAEYPQAQRMFADNATMIAKSLRSLRRGDVKGAFGHLKAKPKQLRGTVSNRWLEMQYGWMPLIQDLYGSVEELQAGLQRPRFRKVKLRKTTEDRGTQSSGWIPPLGRPGQIENTAKTVVKVVAYLRQDSSVSNRLGFTNPANLAWELLPYSFVIDWFIPIGDWLNSLDAEIGIIEIYGTVTTKSKRISTNQWGGMYYLQEEYGRSVFHGLPNPPLPSYTPSLGWKKVANALALLSQLKR